MSSKLKQVKVNFKPEVFERLDTLSQKEGLTKAEWIRKKLGTKIENNPMPRAKKTYKKLPPQLLYELQKQGTNINQIAKYCNEKKLVDSLVYNKLCEIERQLSRILDDS